IYLELWLISRWRFPATPCFTLPVAVNLKRFFTPLFVLSLGILVSLQSRACEQPRQPLMAGRVPECSRKGGRLAEGALQRNRFGTLRPRSALDQNGRRNRPRATRARARHPACRDDLGRRHADRPDRARLGDPLRHQ